MKENRKMKPFLLTMIGRMNVEKKEIRQDKKVRNEWIQLTPGCTRG
jgi:hypothetical protein